MNKIVCFIMLLLLTSCSGNRAAYLQGKIKKSLKENYGIEHGDIVAKFDLQSLSKENRLFAHYYGKAINSSSDNQKFLDDFKKSFNHKNFIESNSNKKSRLLSEHLIKLDNKYKILANNQRKLVMRSSKISNARVKPGKDKSALELLSQLHEATKQIPIFTPMYMPRVTSKFGKRVHPKSNKLTFHAGLDMAGRMNCKVYSAADGIVEATAKASGYGNVVLVRHSKNLKTRYAHLNKFEVKQGQRVIVGQSLGTQGCTGSATGHHLHFEILIGSKAVDPMDFVNHGL